MPRKKKSGSVEADGAETVESVAAAVPKPKAEAKVKAPPQAVPKAEAKAKADAKAKSEPKAKVAPKAATPPKAVEAVPPAKAGSKAGSQAKAAPKAKGEAKPKAEAEPAAASSKAAPKAKAEPAAASSKAAPKAKAEPKAASSKAAPKAKAAKEVPVPAAPEPEVPPQVPDNMEVVKSRRRKRRKAEELPPEEPEVVENLGPSEEETAEQTRIKNEHDSKNNALASQIRMQLKNMPALERKPRDQVIKEVADQKKALESIMTEIDDTLKTVKISRPKNMNIGAIMQQMRDLKLCKVGFDFSETTRQHMMAEMEAALSQALAYDSFRSFQAEMMQIKEQCQARIEANQTVVNTVKSKDNQRRILSLVAEAKGVKAEDLKESDVVSTNVDLSPEVTSVQFLYKRKFEKQYGVVIDRPEGGPGGGKGATAPPPKSLVVRGLQSEVSACIDALRGLNLSERKVVSATSKQAAAIMGPQQANARKLEEDHKGVFVHREGTQSAGQSSIILYGPPKEVAACLKEVQGMLAEEPAAAPAALSMNIEKGFAKCLIGEKGKTVNKMQTDTGTTINVMNHQIKDDDSPAVVRITGPKENQERARTQINTFLTTLTSVFVEAEAEAVTRLYDSAGRRSGKGKGRNSEKANAKGDGKGDSKFAELWNHSGLTCLKKAKGIQLVGEKTEVAKWKAVLEECLRDAGIVPCLVKLSFEQGRLWNQERLDALRDSSGAQKVHKVTKGPSRETFIEISGTDEQKEKARCEIQELNEKLNNTESIDGVSDKAQRSLTAKGAARLRDVEQKFEVSVVLDRKGQSVKIMGEPDAIAAAKKKLEELLAGVTKEIEIEWDEGRIVIGPRGATVNHIKQQSGLESLKVDEVDDVKKVILQGNQEAVDAAEQMVKELLEKERAKAASTAADEVAQKETPKGTGAADEDGEATEVKKSTTESPPKKKEDAPVADTGADDKRSSNSNWAGKKGRHKADKVDIDVSKESFPDLGGKGGKKGTRRPKNSAWKSVEGEDEEGGEQEEEHANDAGADAQEEATNTGGADEKADAGGADEKGDEPKDTEATDEVAGK